jgi:hypothetical protein
MPSLGDECDVRLQYAICAVSSGRRREPLRPVILSHHPFRRADPMTVVATPTAPFHWGANVTRQRSPRNRRRSRHTVGRTRPDDREFRYAPEVDKGIVGVDMQKKTTLVDQYGNALLGKVELVVAVRDANGVINASTAQPLTEWNQGPRSVELVTQAHGYNLLEILTQELGLVDVDEAGLLTHRIVSTLDPHVATMRVLGKIAEALIVKECDENIFANRKWGMYARGGQRPSHGLDHFKAVGTGLNSTKRMYPTKYSAGNTQRDILWIHKQALITELKHMAYGGTNHCMSAGLQVKVSTNGMHYVLPDLKVGRYETALVYFDLANDFDRVANAIRSRQPDVQVGSDLVHGRHVSPEVHERLQSYYPVVLALVQGNLRPDQIITDPLLFEAFKKDVQEQNFGSDIVTL